jgi:lysyl-tRNA synthetase class I
MGNGEIKNPKPPQCTKCGKVMTFRRVEPDVRHTNLDIYKYRCECGYKTRTYVAREE